MKSKASTFSPFLPFQSLLLVFFSITLSQRCSNISILSFLFPLHQTCPLIDLISLKLTWPGSRHSLTKKKPRLSSELYRHVHMNKIRLFCFLLSCCVSAQIENRKQTSVFALKALWLVQLVLFRLCLMSCRGKLVEGFKPPTVLNLIKDKLLDFKHSIVILDENQR